MSNPYLAIDQKIIGDSYTSTEVWDNLVVLCDDLGGRFAGTPEERKAADFIAETFGRYGLRDARLEDYPYPGWSRGTASLGIVEPLQKSINCISLPYCPPSDLSADLISVGFGSPDEYQNLSDRISGCIVLADSGSPPGLGRWVHRMEKFERALLAKAKAFIFVGEQKGTGPETGTLHLGRAAAIPGISVCKEDGEYLLRLLKRHDKVNLRISTTDKNEPRTSWNVAAELPGTDYPDEVVVLGCHYDGHDISQGAVDPASGMVLVMEAARTLALHAKDSLRRTVRFVGFGTEEIGLIGAQRYVDRHSDEMDRIRFMYNLDAAGGSSRKGVALDDWPKLEPFFENAGNEMAADLPVGQKISAYSDNFPFFKAGVPSACMGDPTSPPKGRGFGHTMYDTLDKVELVNLRAGATTAARLALRIANDDGFPAERRDPDAVSKIIETNPLLEGYRVALELAGNS
jgi:hypothetical protein